ncbi:MAG: class I SAM-dependent methyltransferase [Thermodesulfobacteriota bacterium]
MQTKEIRRIYNKTAHSFNRREWLIEFFVLRHYRKKLVSQAKGKVLEIAIGTGRNPPYYHKECEIIGVDSSEKMLEIARSLAHNLGLSVTLLTMDVENLAFKDNTFDTVLCTLSLCTVTNPLQALYEMKRVCKSGGKILLLEHVRSHNQILGKIQDLLTLLTVRKIGCHLNRDTLGDVKKAGLHIDYLESHLTKIIKIIHASFAKQ